MKKKEIRSEDQFYARRHQRNECWQSNLFNEFSLRSDLKKEIKDWEIEGADFDRFRNDLFDFFDKTSKRALEKWNEQDTVHEWIVPILDMLGWKQANFKENVSFTFRNRGETNILRPDLLYFATPGEKDLILIKKTGDVAKARQLVEMVIEAKRWHHLERVRQSNCNSKKSSPKDEKNDSSSSLSPEDQIINYQNMLQKPFGILTDGAKWQLFHRLESDEYRRKKFNFDLYKIRNFFLRGAIKSNHLDELKYFYYLFRREAHVGKKLCEKLLRNNKNYLTTVVEDMKSNFVDAMNIACNGFANATGKESLSLEEIDLIRNTSESHIFNIMFIKSCEANDVLRLNIQDFVPNSLSEVIQSISYPNFKPELDEYSDSNTASLKLVFEKMFKYKPTGYELFERLRRLYSIIEKGTFGLLIPSFGQTVLTKEEKQFSKKHRLDNATMVRLLFNLGYVKVDNEYQQIPYNYFSPRQLGSIYESFLEFQLKFAETDLIYRDKKWQKANLSSRHLANTKLPCVNKGQLYFEKNKEDRKKSGSYYTPDFIVRYIVDETLAPLVKGKKSSEILKLRVCDPAMGSSHFLNAATEYLTKAYRHQLQNEVNDDIESFSESARKVLHNCVYGVDINPRAVKLSKMALWLVTAHEGSNLEPLNDQLICGDSLSDSMDWNQFFHTKDAFESGIFDAIIGNPPYIGEKGYKKLFDPIKSQRIGKYYQGKMDYCYFFIHLGIDILKRNGLLGYIIPNSFFTATCASKLREDLFSRANVKTIIDFNEWTVFKEAKGQFNAVLMFTKNLNSKKEKCNTLSLIGKGLLEENESLFWDSLVNVESIEHSELFYGKEKYINLGSDKETNSILEKISSYGVTLGNEFNSNTGLYTAADSIFSYERDEIPNELESINKIEKTVIRSFFKNSDISKYVTESKTTKKLIYHHEKSSYSLKEIPNLMKYLKKHKEKLSTRKDSSLKGALKRGRWDVISLPKLTLDFLGEKIVAPQRSKTNTFGYNNIEWYASADVYFITATDKSKISLKSLTGLLNSKLIYFWLYHKGKKKGEVLELYQKPLSEIPLPNSKNWKALTKIEKLVDKILKKGRDESVESEIDDLTYELYGIDKKEAKLIEDFYDDKHQSKLDTKKAS